MIWQRIKLAFYVLLHGGWTECDYFTPETNGAYASCNCA
jgi:hypothetical protein